MRLVLGLLSLLVLMGLAPAAHARAAIEGNWSGSGTVHYEGGADPVRCRLSFSASTGRTFLLSATCATTSGTFRQDGRVVHVGGNRYTGRMYNPQYQVSGTVTISVTGNRQTVRARGDKGWASLTLRRQ